MIPKRLSQTWKSSVLPDAASVLVRGWQHRHPDWEFRLYDDQAAREVMCSVAPDKIALYDALPFGVMRADLFRYAVIWRDGGVYADIDMECLRAIDDLLEGHSCLLAIEARLGSTRTRELGYAKAFQIANCIFAAKPRHPFIRAALDRAFDLIAACRHIDQHHVEDLTGPRMLTRLFFEGQWSDVALAQPIVLMAPLFYPTAAPLGYNIRTRHRTFGTWKSDRGPTTLRRRWIERNRLVWPFPRRLTASDPGSIAPQESAK